MNAQDLKNSILQLAIQGKLVEQRKEEGTAKELIEEIKAEKERLIKEKKIKKEKPLAEITEDEVPFEIPESWEWVRLREVCSEITKGTTPRGGNVAYLDKGIGFLRAENVAGFDILDLSSMKYIDRDTHENFLKRSILQADDILITIAGTLGRTAIVRKDNLPLNTNQAVSIVRLINSSQIDLIYLVYAINAPVLQRALIGQKKITAIPNLTLEIISNCIVPIPPLAEQRRIVTKIEELMPYIEKYGVAHSKLEEFNKKFPEDMQKSILQYAIQGKLVEQREEDGTAQELYKQIQEEKEKLIREKKIKKEKPLAEITEDEVPFEIPESWKWVRLGELAWYLDAGKSPNCVKQNVKGDKWGVITTTAIQTNYFDESQNKILPVDFIVKQEMEVIVGDVLITRAGPTNRTGVSCVVNKITRNLILSDKTVRINLSDKYLNKQCIVMMINSPAIRAYVINMMSGMDKQQVNISQDKIRNIIIPLPPLAEQKRIVAKIEEMLPYCQQLVK